MRRCPNRNAAAIRKAASAAGDPRPKGQNVPLVDPPAPKGRFHGNRFITASARAASVVLKQVLAGEHGSFGTSGREAATLVALRLWQKSQEERRELVSREIPSQVRSLVEVQAPEIAIDRDMLRIWWPEVRP